MERADFLDELAQLVADAGVAAITNIRVGKVRATPDTCITFIGLPGTNLTEERDVPELHFPRFQVLTRSKDYNEASSMMEGVRETLHGRIGLLLPHFRVMRLHAEQDGGPIGEDDMGRSEFSINFNTEYHYTDSL